ncbi:MULTISPECIES: DUF4097 family beta strand repeat-containing protein [unclassified Enterococcus]|uniref:DUF4097 family beta strand repeat-containing protein n=1 Tax=unclassified Enterococcus TaxID=2608891 RepID=UPI001551D719|nr:MULTISPECIES: DUF4097 family beta strand repeat-containing protein [unclassified Enterococcus]MBS7576347.1 DUF4097 family beta strand repeat protein [Enterococcus sp. MMGLQ5-2]MBS7583579.1 DUF4097 family beta strand repeat protein [Enterococcus sp. MMGLQ5-1]NPD11441.1 DUF4097 family beta strand repeat protein [Enterococcus sp. MMGLQ5-1]NPD36185.1 DUF4097 family beta strand repeat protein [Enterococcus sp. MMGLQ5-2]
MDKKSRILELVKKDIISADEAIVLLEQLEETKTPDVQKAEIEDNQENLKAINAEQVTEETKEAVESPFDEPKASEDENIYQTLKDLEDAKQVEDSLPDDEEGKESKTNKSDFSEQFNQAFNQAKTEFEKAKPQIKEVTKQTAEIFKSTFSLLGGTVRDYVKSEDGLFIKPSSAATTIEKSFTFEDLTAIDVEETSGRIEFIGSDDDQFTVNAQIKIYGSLDEMDALELFDEKSSIEVVDHQLKFSVLNKRMNVDLLFKVPQNKLNNLSVKTINGDIILNGLLLEDAYLKSTNGNIKVENNEVTNLEIEGVNGQLKLINNKIFATVINMVNGSITANGNIEKIKVKLVNGDIKLTLNQETLRIVEANNVNGAVKLAVPRKLGIKGEIRTTFGKIFDKLEDLSTVTEQNISSEKYKTVEREGNAHVSLDIKTTTGNIYIKDAEK